MEKSEIVWTDYIKYRVGLRGYNFEKIEEILRYSDERYFDVVTHRQIVIGSHGDRHVMIPYEKRENFIIPVTIHVITRQQINFRLKSGRFVHG